MTLSANVGVLTKYFPRYKDRKRFRLRLERDGISFGFLFRFISAAVSVIFSTIVVLVVGFWTDWELTKGLLVFYGALISLMILFGEHIRSSVFERVVSSPEERHRKKDAEEEYQEDTRLGLGLEQLSEDIRTREYPTEKQLRYLSQGEVAHNVIAYASTKRLIDIVFSAVSLFLLLPALVVIAAAIKFESRGPILYRSTRHGLDGEPIELIKFRTMYPDPRVAMHGSDAVWRSARDHRVTRVGRFLRRTGMDVLPTLFNVLQGRMSLIGPRPILPAPTESYAHLSDNFPVLHTVKPGLISWTPLNGYSRVKDNISYIEKMSFSFDMRILARLLWGRAHF